MTFVDQLRRAVPAAGVVDDADVVDAYRHDAAAWCEAGKPAAVVVPRTTEEVAAAVEVAAAHGVPVVARGAGSGLSGGANAIDGCLIISLVRMDRILSVDADDQLAVVQPGVINADLRRAAAKVGLFYPPDPASYEMCTIGGNVATNAGGLCCVRYGVTGDFVLGLEVVMADGSVVRTGRRTIKGVAGYDLTRLFVGSEGTLGIVTEVTVRLRPLPPPVATVVGVFPYLGAAGDGVVAATLGPQPPSLLELLDQTCLRAVDDWKNMELDRDAAALLVAQAEDVSPIARAWEEAGASYVAATDDPDEGEMLLAARRLAYPALERMGATLLDDVGVPRSRISALLAGVERIASEEEVLIATFGHAGDGNMHPTIVYDAASVPAVEAAGRAFERIVGLAIDLGGTITGEHGVGTLKRRFLERELHPGAVDLHRVIKAALDPAGLLNPGKATP